MGECKIEIGGGVMKNWNKGGMGVQFFPLALYLKSHLPKRHVLKVKAVYHISTLVTMVNL